MTLLGRLFRWYRPKDSRRSNSSGKATLILPSQTAEARKLLRTLASRAEPLVRQEAAWKLGKLQQVGVTDGLVKALSDEEWVVRCAAAQSLGTLEDARAVDALIRALSDIHYRVVEEAAVALGKIGDARAIEPLTRFFYRGSSLVASLESSGIQVPTSARSMKEDLEAENVKKAVKGALDRLKAKPPAGQ